VEQLVGRRLGPYELQSKLGSGGMGTVYRAVHRTLGQTRAIKILPPMLANDESFVKRFQREAMIAANLHHPHVVQIYDVREEDGYFYIAMELIEGSSLEDLIRQQGALPGPRIIALLRQLAEALDFAHGRSVLHRDIKPANVLVRPDGHVTLADFGIARAATQSGLSLTHGAIGTPAYMAPEIWRGEPATPAVDLYALGIMAFQMLTGRLPFPEPTPASLMNAHLTKPPPSPRTVAPHLPTAVERVVTRQLAKQPLARYPTAGAFVEALEEALGSGSTRRSSATAPVPTSNRTATTTPVGAIPRPPAATPAQTSVLPMLLGAVAVVAVLIGVGAVWLGQGFGSSTTPTPTTAPAPTPGARAETAPAAAAPAATTPVPVTPTTPPITATRGLSGGTVLPTPPTLTPTPAAPMPTANPEIAKWRQDLNTSKTTSGAQPVLRFPKTLFLPDRALDSFKYFTLLEAGFQPEALGLTNVYIIRLAMDGAGTPGSTLTAAGSAGRGVFDRATTPDPFSVIGAFNQETYCQLLTSARVGTPPPNQELFRGLKVKGNPATVEHIVCCNGEGWRVFWYDEQEDATYSLDWYLDAAAGIGGEGKLSPNNQRYADQIVAAASLTVPVKGGP
jgi:serine/threonine-protein kinase